MTRRLDRLADTIEDYQERLPVSRVLDSFTRRRKFDDMHIMFCRMRAVMKRDNLAIKITASLKRLRPAQRREILARLAERRLARSKRIK